MALSFRSNAIGADGPSLIALVESARFEWSRDGDCIPSRDGVCIQRSHYEISYVSCVACRLYADTSELKRIRREEEVMYSSKRKYCSLISPHSHF
jgi:hypothetical protein